MIMVLLPKPRISLTAWESSSVKSSAVSSFKTKTLQRDKSAALERDMIVSMIFWGPPGVGKTTLARIIAGRTKSHCKRYSPMLK